MNDLTDAYTLTKKFLLASAIWLAAVSSVFLSRLSYIKENCFIEDGFKLQLIQWNDMDMQEDKYVITGTDAFIIYDLGEEQRLFNGKLYLKSVTEEEIPVQIFYAGRNKKFREENSYFSKIKKGKDDLILQFPDTNIQYLRVDICKNTGEQVTRIRQMTAAAKDNDIYLKIFSIFYNKWGLAAAFLMILGVVLYFRQLRDFAGRHEYLTACVCVLLCVTGLYWKYIFGDQYFIFYDVAGDSLFQTYPNLLHTARRIQDGEWAARFSFSIALGDAQSALLPDLHNWIALFGEEHIAYLLGLSQWMKVVLAGILAYVFARLYGLQHRAGLMAALAYAFNSEFMIRGAWISYPNTALLLILWLTAYEYLHVKKRMWYLPIATVSFFYSIDIYYCVFWGAVLGAYIVFRKLSEEGISKKTAVDLCKTECIYLFFAALGMADTVISRISNVLSSVRFTGNVSNFDSLKLFTSLKAVLTAFARTFGMSVNGITDYKGKGNFLEGPAFYCGIWMVLLVPVSIYYMPGRKKKFYILGYALFGIYMGIVPVRFIVNGFAGDKYKLNALWVIVLVLLTAMHGLRLLFEKDIEFGKTGRLIFNLTVGAAAAGMILLLCMGYAVRLDSWLISVGFIAGYGILMNLMFWGRMTRRRTAGILCICMMAEVLSVSWECVNDRTVVTKEQMEEGRFYNSAYQETVDALKESDTGWYRLEKKSGSVFFCDPLGQGYYGTTAYIGGIGAGTDMNGIFNRLGLPHSGAGFFYGSGGNLYADALFGVKYYLIEKGRTPDAYGLSYLMTVDGVDIYKNDFALPLAYTYSQAMSQKEFMKYSEADRRRILLQNCVLEDADNAGAESGSFTDTRKMKRADVVYKKGKYYQDIPKGSVLIIQIKADINGMRVMHYEDGQHNRASRYFNAESDNEIELYVEDLYTVWFDFSKKDWKKKPQITFYCQDAETYYANMQENIQALKEDTVKITDTAKNHIQGQVTCPDERILASSIPYDAHWNVIVNGAKADILKVNTGFIGTKLAAGEHTIEFIYQTNSWLYDNKFKCVGFLLAILAAVSHFVRRKKTNEENISSSAFL